MVEEKRRYIRWERKVRVTYSFDQSDESSEGVFTENISEVGTQIITEDIFELGQFVRIKFEFSSDSVPIIVDCRVVYVRSEKEGNRVGLQFIEIDEFQKERLIRCLMIASKE